MLSIVHQKVCQTRENSDTTEVLFHFNSMGLSPMFYSVFQHAAQHRAALLPASYNTAHCEYPNGGEKSHFHNRIRCCCK